MLAAAIFVTAPAAGEDGPAPPPIGGAAIQVDRVQVDPDSRSGDVRGISVSFRYRVGRVDTENALFLLAFFDEVRGLRVKSAVDDWTYRDRRMNLHGKTQLITVPRHTWREGSVFVPFYAMKLAPGRHSLALSFEGVSDVRACQSGGRPSRLEVRGGRGVVIDVVKPPFRTVQLLVRRVNVVEKATDTAFSARRARPDLAWKAFFQIELNKGIVHSSATRDDCYSGTWSQYTDPFPFSEGDRLTLDVIDRDLMSHDLLGHFTFTLEDLVGRAATTPPLADGAVTSLLLAPAKLR